jgi:formate-dependent nitrite reductase cytochrome c552 subunit
VERACRHCHESIAHDLTAGTASADDGVSCIRRDASRQEMRSYVCGQCHVEYMGAERAAAGASEDDGRVDAAERAPAQRAPRLFGVSVVFIVPAGPLHGLAQRHRIPGPEPVAPCDVAFDHRDLQSSARSHERDQRAARGVNDFRMKLQSIEMTFPIFNGGIIRILSDGHWLKAVR